MGLVVSATAKDLINQLLKKDPNERLGIDGDVEAILSHPWFADIDREHLMQKKIEAPYMPPDVKSDEEYLKKPKEVDHSMVPVDKQEVIRNSQFDFTGF